MEDTPPVAGQVMALLHSLRGAIEERFRGNGIPANEAERILHETLLALVLRWNEIEDHRAWLLETIKARCRSFSERIASHATEEDDEPHGNLPS